MITAQNRSERRAGALKKEATRAAALKEYRILSPLMNRVGTELRFTLLHQENHAVPYLSFNLAKALLPPKGTSLRVCSLEDYGALAAALTASVDSFLLRQGRGTKSTHRSAMNIALAISKFFEFLWLNGIHHTSHVTAAVWREFRDKYRAGNWFGALEIERRIKEHLVQCHLSGLPPPKTTRLMLTAIGSNLDPQSIRLNGRPTDTDFQVSASNRCKTASQAVVVATLDHLNNLNDIRANLRTPAIAHDEPYRYARSCGLSAPGRTKNMTPEALGSVLRECYVWIQNCSPIVFSLLASIRSGLELSPEEHTQITALVSRVENAHAALRQSADVPINRAPRKRSTDVAMCESLIRAVFASCFITIATMNGRRKDEVESRSIGLYQECFTIIDEDLGIYESLFYCEKHVCDYDRFFVNEITFEALQVLKRFSDIAWQDISKDSTTAYTAVERKLFLMPSTTPGARPAWFKYCVDKGSSLISMLATGQPGVGAPKAHMLRRAYAVVYIYRYEIEDLLWLSQQLRHKTLVQSLTYVHDPASRSLQEGAAFLWSPNHHGDGFSEHAEDLRKEIDEYSLIKLERDVLEILATKSRTAGHFQKLINRFFRLMSGRIAYDDADLANAAKTITAVLTQRGHRVIPMRHGNCNAGPVKRSARCFTDGRLARENASPQTCGSCPYHSVKASHAMNIFEEAIALQNRLDALPAKSTQRIAMQKSSDSAIALAQHYFEVIEDGTSEN